MERLTSNALENGWEGFWVVEEDDTQTFVGKSKDLYKAITKLSAYEDTGLEPEEIKKSKKELEDKNKFIDLENKNMSDYMQKLSAEYGCLLNDDLSIKYGDCRKGCYFCIKDALLLDDSK